MWVRATLWGFLVFMTVSSSAEKVLLLALEGLTSSLLARVATPALDSIVTKGSISLLVPEFPSETLPTLASMVTGQHTEMTGILDTEVLEPSGELVTDSNPEFWKNLRNISTLWTLGTKDQSPRVGAVRWPGTQTASAQGRLIRWGETPQSDISEDDSTKRAGSPTESRRRRSARTWVREEESGEEEKEDEVKEEKDRRGLFSEESTEEEEKKQVEENQGEEEGKEEKEEEKEEEEEDPSVDSYHESFNKTTDEEWLMWADQVQTVVSWLGREMDPVDLVLMYVEEPGSQIRSWGPESEQAGAAVRKVDQLLALLTETLTKAGLREHVNLVITGIHGFAEVSTDKVFDISGLVADPASIHGHSPVLNIQPKAGESLDTYARLQTSRDKDKFDLYTRHLLPASYHYSHSDRVAEIILVAKEGFAFSTDFWSEAKSLNKAVSRPASLDNKYGKAGYEATVESMGSVVVMEGPGVAVQAVPDQLTIKVNAVDIFPLVSHLLGISPPPSNGSISNLRHLLLSPPSQTVEVIQQTIHYYTNKDRLPQTVTVLASSTLLLVLLICCCACSVRRRQAQLGVAHSYKYSSVKSNRRTEGRVDGSEEREGEGDKVGLLTSALMEDDLDLEEPA